MTTIAVLVVGLAADVGVVWLAMSWSAVMGEVYLWAPSMLVLVQFGLWSAAAVACVLMWRRGRSGL
ncbi:hypothetical protein [Curtobacterium sp. MCBA15_001]|uniref:hypothetical protein n=1 Tax=Curtobacterium sp. MCBA15_001 TaxID=1898731 RepID=UPI0008DDA688|nr:hypothetical protein [Curtobacterium sp. MCBA15_001]OIH96537.1 hypothetical protein BIU90_16980 [Curtobacterium sp. MCBA15_001]